MACKEGKTTPGDKKVSKYTLYPQSCPNYFTSLLGQAIAANTCTEQIHRQNFVSSGTEVDTGKQLTSSQQQEQHTVPSRPARPLPNNVPGIRKHQRATSLVVYHPPTGHTTPFSRVGGLAGWRRKSAPRASGRRRGRVPMSWFDGSCLRAGLVEALAYLVGGGRRGEGEERQSPRHDTTATITTERCAVLEGSSTLDESGWHI